MLTDRSAPLPTGLRSRPTPYTVATRVNAVALKGVQGPDHVRLFEPSAMLLR